MTRGMAAYTVIVLAVINFLNYVDRQILPPLISALREDLARAGLLGLVGVAAVASQIAWILFLVGIILLVIHLVSGHRVPPPI